MKSGICYKCKSNDVYSVDLSKSDYDIPLSTSTKVKLRYYICTKCGYVESYVANSKYLEKISLFGKYISPNNKSKQWD